MAQQERQRVGTNTKYAAQVGYSRAVRVGGQIEVAGTTALNEDTGEVVGPGDAYAQASFVLAKVRTYSNRHASP